MMPGRIAAAKRLGSSGLSGCTLITTLQPCELCFGTMRVAGVSGERFAAQTKHVAEGRFAFPGLDLDDFAAASSVPHVAIGGVHEARVLKVNEEAPGSAAAASGARPAGSAQGQEAMWRA